MNTDYIMHQYDKDGLQFPIFIAHVFWNSDGSVLRITRLDDVLVNYTIELARRRLTEQTDVR